MRSPGRLPGTRERRAFGAARPPDRRPFGAPAGLGATRGRAACGRARHRRERGRVATKWQVANCSLAGAAEHLAEPRFVAERRGRSRPDAVVLDPAAHGVRERVLAPHERRRGAAVAGISNRAPPRLCHRRRAPARRRRSRRRGSRSCSPTLAAPPTCAADTAPARRRPAEAPRGRRRHDLGDLRPRQAAREPEPGATVHQPRRQRPAKEDLAPWRALIRMQAAAAALPKTSQEHDAKLSVETSGGRQG